MKNIAVYPGTFDPVTNGHIDIIERGLQIFDEVIVAVAVSTDKQTLFPVEERIEMINSATEGLKNLRVESFDGLLIDFVKDVQAKAIIRGLRAVSDFEYEFQMAVTNRKLLKEVDTIFLMSTVKYSYLSSSIVKEVAKYGGDIEGMVPALVSKKLKEIYGTNKGGE
ncbi:MAG: pantetheine-phosphate adenylyltransferase [Candidatus Schekmanbacteria bacterium]|nr:MAG: pantetheine-phosphate adenylyltransferase [Candidatus Schekmanbacteria bacterium]